MINALHYIKVIYNITSQNSFKKMLRKLFTRYSPRLHYKYVTQYKHFVENISRIPKLAILFTNVPYEKDMNQRSINLSKYLVSKGYLVFFVQWRWAPNNVVDNAFSEVDQNTFCIPLYALDLSQLIFVKKIIGICAMVNPFITGIIKDINQLGGNTYYDIHDDWESLNSIGFTDWYPGRTHEEELITIVNRVSAVTKEISDKFSKVREDIIISSNGFSLDIVGKQNRDIVKPIKDEIIIGYFGHLTPRWINWKFVFNLSKIDKIRIEIIGYGAVPSLLREFKRYGINYHGKIPVNKLYRYVHSWHFGLVPFKTGELSSAVDPIKVYEYIYYGLTCLVTGIPHLKKFPNCLLFNDDEELTYQYLFDNHSVSNKKAVNKFLNANTWDKQFDKIFFND